MMSQEVLEALSDTYKNKVLPMVRVDTKVKRAIDEMVTKGLIKKVDFLNNREMKGSRYQLFLPGSVKR
ncbi:MAG: hypothetical protein Q8P40_04405 [Nitrospirota bacterium]|nr:hypothetical protein [Nitrospirota bacterium]